MRFDRLVRRAQVSCFDVVLEAYATAYVAIRYHHNNVLGLPPV